MAGAKLNRPLTEAEKKRMRNAVKRATRQMQVAFEKELKRIKK